MNQYAYKMDGVRPRLEPCRNQRTATPNPEPRYLYISGSRGVKDGGRSEKAAEVKIVKYSALVAHLWAYTLFAWFPSF